MPNDPERVAVVTGGSRGIGLAVVRKLVGDGFLVAACSRHPSPALPTGDEGNVRFFQLDLADPNSVKECAQALHRQYQRIDALVNCAGVAAGGLPATRFRSSRSSCPTTSR
jgi:3-oxoacyl-[acyl-carrier protein] reductase